MGAGFTPGPSSLFLTANGRAQLMGQLFSPTDKLQVTGRRRFRTNGLENRSAAASSTTLYTTNLGLWNDILQAGDGVLIDKVSIVLTNASAAGLTLAGLSFGIAPASGINIPIGQVIATTFAIPATNQQELIIEPSISTALLSSLDLNSMQPTATTATGAIGPLPLAAQPLSWFVGFSVANSTAAVITFQDFVLVFHRIVRGLEEG